MKIFECQNCNNLLYFENIRCERCQFDLGFLPASLTLSALKKEGEGFIALADPNTMYRYCKNAEYQSCNWLVPHEFTDELCIACQHNRTIPDLSITLNLTRWQKIEIAKHRLFYTLFNLKLLNPNLNLKSGGPEFDFLADSPDSTNKVMTGHDNGLITLRLAEADDAEREKLRQDMDEVYRTLLGHFRHEVGHFYWDKLVRDRGNLDSCRALFGDDRQDYSESLNRHYSNGAPANWQNEFISTYASSHPWEDFAETWAHYLHIVDTLEIARSFGLQIEPKVAVNETLSTEINFDPHQAQTSKKIINTWLPLTFAINSINRSMGQKDLYPFVLSPKVIEKFDYIHNLIQSNEYT
ncbi:MAG: putative zinc-binding peptidase [Pseudomonadota bacterium]